MELIGKERIKTIHIMYAFFSSWLGTGMVIVEEGFASTVMRIRVMNLDGCIVR